MYLDYGTGSYLTVCDDDEVPLYQYHNIGICCGSGLVDVHDGGILLLDRRRIITIFQQQLGHRVI